MAATEPGAVNARVVPAVQYDIDPRGWGMFAALTRANHGSISGRGARPVIETVERHHGDSPVLQRFTGLARLIARPRVERNEDMADVRSADTADTARSIFEDRMTRRRR